MPITTATRFAELRRLGLEVIVTCQKCRHIETIDGRDPRFARRRVAGARYRCSEPGCGGIGLPAIGRERRWTQQLAEHHRPRR